MNDKRNLSADLIRVGEYLYRGNDRMADKFIQVCRSKNVIDDGIENVLKNVELRKGGRDRATDRALTWGRLLLRG